MLMLQHATDGNLREFYETSKEKVLHNFMDRTHRIASEITSRLKYLHSKHIIHRNLII
ncbi:hypothetical protein C2G38_2109543 [Gigaspora rosea]|uniref:Protein kinase domain-containing protein n=1 Tax=Gigaspora rosea TaxID=44941 RepID=A0A397UFI1_9GLOM|nr:hypothetical protein C2G38_2109543 [Gigaspora rosea]